MRTKTLLLTAALSAAGIATSMAQVYSVNAVGYVNTPLVTGFNLISNPLDNKSSANGNSIANLFGTQLPEDSIVYKFSNGSFVGGIFQFSFGAWPAAASTTLVPPGEGVFVRVGAAATVTFVGDVPQGSLSNPIPAGFSIRASQVPQAGTVTVLGFPAAEGDAIYQYDETRVGSKYSISQYEFGQWSTVPTLKVGEAFFLRTGAARAWTRTFSVNQ
jgi:hypothetical protein